MSEKKTAKEKKPRGRPCTYSHAVAEKICERLAGGESLNAICTGSGYPPSTTVRQWVVDDRHGFAARYARARDIGLDFLADEIIEIANTPEIGERVEITEADGDNPEKKKITQADMIEHRRLKVEARKWYLSKLAPKRYGDKTHVEIEDVTPLADRLARARKRE